VDDRWIVVPECGARKHGPSCPPACWARATHYTDRAAIWVKAYVDLLNRDEYLDLTAHRRAVLHGIWLLYAMNGRRLAHDTRTLSRRLGLKVTTADLEALNQAGWITTSASTPLATREHEASLEVEVEEKKDSSTSGIEPRARGVSGSTKNARCPKCDLAFASEQRVLEHLDNVHWGDDDEPPSPSARDALSQIFGRQSEAA
jgi:hypothetical protein